jgi:ABC-type transporter Mla subunit MlaD
MNKRALLGLYTLLSIVALLGLFAVLSDFSTKLRGYKIGVRFPSAAGLHSGALIYESGVTVGTVDSVAVLPDYSTEVILALRSDVQVPANAHYLILQPLTGDPTLRIYPRLSNDHGGSSAPMPHRILPIKQQPFGESTLSLAEFLANSQQQFAHVDALLEEFQQHGPSIFDNLNKTLINANHLMITANESMAQISLDTHRSLGAFADSSGALTAQLSQTLSTASSELLDVTSRLQESTRAGQPHLDHVLLELDNASHSLAASVDSLHAIAADPQLHDNVVKTTHSLAATAATFAALLGDMRQVTGNAQTQAELRDAVANIDAASERANSFLGRFGKSHVPNVDYPASTVTPVPSIDGSALPAPTVPPNGTEPNSANPVTSAAPIQPSVVKHRVSDLEQQGLISFSLRESELGPMHSTAQGAPLRSALLGPDRGPQTDVGVSLNPGASSSYLVSANDIGGSTPTFSLLDVQHTGAAYFGGGFLYSRLGIVGGVKAGAVGAEARVYDPRRGSVDLYGNVYALPKTTLFIGERDVTRDTRRPVYGVNYNF